MVFTAARAVITLQAKQAEQAKQDEEEAMKIGVVIPSRLALSPDGKTLWLQSALESIRAQTCFDRHEWVVVVGLDEGAKKPSEEGMATHFSFVHASTRGQAAAVNAAAHAATAAGVEVMSFLEDDDLWHPEKMAIQLSRLEQAPFLSCSQWLMSEDRQAVVGLHDYPIPTSWIMTTDVWKKIGGFNESFRFHVDSEWIGRLNEEHIPRIHLIENRNQVCAWYFRFASQVHHHSEIVSTGLAHPLATRTHNLGGGMSAIERDLSFKTRSNEEYALLQARHGEIPW